jgi:hypothetical protein
MTEKTRGRPQKDLTELPEDWYDYILTEMEQGASLEEVKAHFGISNDLHTRWMKDEKEYSETIKRGVELSHAWWLLKGRKNLENKEFSATLWYMNMKNRFNWKDRQDVTTNDKDLPTPLLSGMSRTDINDDIN